MYTYIISSLSCKYTYIYHISKADFANQTLNYLTLGYWDARTEESSIYT